MVGNVRDVDAALIVGARPPGPVRVVDGIIITRSVIHATNRGIRLIIQSFLSY